MNLWRSFRRISNKNFSPTAPRVLGCFQANLSVSYVFSLK
nr:MAG TPA: hypothetical protein [Caudoviricetes sp.]